METIKVIVQILIGGSFIIFCYYIVLNFRIDHFRKTCKAGDSCKFWVDDTIYTGAITYRVGDTVFIKTFMTGNKTNKRNIKDITI
uniref:Uncharacterized protein n=1 Tax=viral metagenome TaxID=1070528 RepID=A0A6M3X4E6_9ZZZZ